MILKLVFVVIMAASLAGCQTTDTRVNSEDVNIYGGYYHPIPLHKW